jgi:predicted O-methyltransferase YrrM
MDSSLDHRPNHGWRARHVFGALGLRRPAAQHSGIEGALLKRFAAEASTVVELGVAEGGSAFELRGAMPANGTLYLVDPYEPGRFGISMPLVVAQRLVRRVDNASVVWLRAKSSFAAKDWRDPIDLLFIDGDHSLAGVSRDWADWTPYVREGRFVALHDARVFPNGWTDKSFGSVQFASNLVGDVRWREVASVDSLVVFQRVG